MSNTTNLSLPYLAAAQAQKHVTLNDALTLIDGLLHLSVISRVVTSPPGAPLDGDRYLLPTGVTGIWTGNAGKIAQFTDNAWLYHVAKVGWSLWVADENISLTFNGTTWGAAGVPSALQNLSLLGVNATADASNKLTVASANSLFNHAGAGHLLKINKNANGDTASVLFQTNYSGRAEFGLAGDDHFRLKVSADGSTWTEAIVVNASTGAVTLTGQNNHGQIHAANFIAL